MTARSRALSLAREHLVPARVATLEALGADLVIGRREGYRIWDLDGRALWDLGLNGGTYNLGHRHPALVAALRSSLEHLDIGNHHLVSPARSELAAALVAVSPGGALRRVVLTAGAGEAVDVAVRSARRATARRNVVALEAGYHGRTGLSGAAGDPSNARAFLSDQPDVFARIPWGDADAAAAALEREDVACVLLETIPATAGFPTVPDGYHKAVRAACDRTGTMLIADEVQTGMGRTGRMWGIETFGVVPDAMVVGKGLSGGLYPVAGVLLNEPMGAWLDHDGWGHVSTYGGAELGCAVAIEALRLAADPENLQHGRDLATHVGRRLEDLRQQHPTTLAEVHQCGLVIGLRLHGPDSALPAVSALIAHGVWVFPAGFDRSVVQFKPGLLLTLEEADDVLDRVGLALDRLARHAA